MIQTPEFVGKLVLAAVLGVAACSHGQSSSAPPPAPASGAPEMLKVQGQVRYLQRMAMPPHAVLKVQVADVSLMDTAAVVLAESSEVFGERQVPKPFSLQVPKSAIKPGHRYAVSARITVGDRLAFITTSHHGVLNEGQQGPLDLVLDIVRGAQ